MRIALAQIDVKYGNPEENHKTVQAVIERAAAKMADVVVLPEMWNTGYALNKLDTLADKDALQTKKLLSRLSLELKINIVGGSVAIERDQKFYNEMLSFNREGKLMSSYDKVHRFGLMREDRYITAGSTENLFSIDEVSAMGVICYDIRFPEWLRKQAAKGPEIIFVSAEWPSARITQWQLLLQARAIENQAYVIAVNRVGNDPDNAFGGDSMVINPLGQIISKADDRPTLMITEIDLSEVKKVRGQIPVFKDRRTELY
ncbi:carbon-nitrogen family hydrolase [Xylocopilactobacillus apis]|uniref:Carbon-nitrogen hydrolase n=1 Tax=Xylocopilactobacillus apis TaxID=2932183 RepID=A0AAU9CX62_9LACO|nr:carbon-nitrogen family hydrolase [Xylocopilactobacillus apis]BDR55959.1 carbon-nitrogen hydrolase [Xylocopilactobacillus apis]